MSFSLNDLFAVIQSRQDTDPDQSYVAKLFSRGTSKIAQKVGEEAVEVAIEAAQNNKKGIREESADLLFHLMILWADQGLEPKDITKILEKRFGTGGLDEKANRKK